MTVQNLFQKRLLAVISFITSRLYDCDKHTQHRVTGRVNGVTHTGS